MRQSRADLKPALAHLESVLAVVNKNEDNLDPGRSELMAPFYTRLRQRLRQRSLVGHLHPEPAAGTAGGLTWMIIKKQRSSRWSIIALRGRRGAHDVRRRRHQATGRRTSRARSRSTRAARCGSSASPIGKVEKVTPSGDRGRGDDQLRRRRPSCLRTCTPLVVPPSIVGDRFIQLAPAWEEAATCWLTTPGLGLARTGVPVELDETYAASSTVRPRGLGPNGANADGALSELVSATADNLTGHGAELQLRRSRTSAGSAPPSTDNKEELFGSAEQLGKFIEHPGRERPDRPRLQPVAGRRVRPARGRARGAGGLAAATSAIALDAGVVLRHTRTASVLGRNIAGLNRVSKVLVKQRDALDEVLEVGPLALNNLALTYNPQAGTLDTQRQPRRRSASRSKPTRRPSCAGFTDQVKGVRRRVRHDQADRCPAAAP